MDPWAYWVVAGLALGILEVVSGGQLVLAFLGVGALAGGVAAALTGIEWVPFAVFAVVSAAMVGVVRPLAQRHMVTPRELRSGTAALVGADADVLVTVDGRDGRVKLKGEIWSARAYDGHSVYEPGTTVQVLQIDGATALVA